MLSRIFSVMSAGRADRAVRARSTSTRPCLGPSTLHLRVLPSLDEPGSKYLLSSGDRVEFYLTKCRDLQGQSQYQWLLAGADCNDHLNVSYDGMGDAVQVYDQAGTLVVAIDLCRSSYYTVVKFSWRSRKYRWVMTGKDARNSQRQLRISLFEGSCRQSLASFHGPGFQQKQFWVQQLQHDILLVQQTDERAWLQVLVATCLVAAKAQRHKDKITDQSRRSGHGFV